MNPEIDRINDIRKTIQIDRELSRLRADIVALQETRLADSGSIRESNFTFFWHGKRSDDRREHGVGFAVRNTLLQCITSPVATSERIITLRVNSRFGVTNIISV